MLVPIFSSAGTRWTGSTKLENRLKHVFSSQRVAECSFPPWSSVKCNPVLFNPHTKVDPHAFDLVKINTRLVAGGEKKRSALSRWTDPHTAGLSEFAGTHVKVWLVQLWWLWFSHNSWLLFCMLWEYMWKRPTRGIMLDLYWLSPIQHIAVVAFACWRIFCIVFPHAIDLNMTSCQLPLHLYGAVINFYPVKIREESMDIWWWTSEGEAY